ncbi:MAG: hypothetical protein EPO07_04530 [Verrucomicrobia bacterium]|nr:MAG: hypothetical protein EPO07_04530 [Verrucomicrobiota bacterium]
MNNEVVSTGVAAPATVINKTRKSPGPINQALARELSRAEFVGLAAQNAAYATGIGNRDIDGDFVSAFLDDVDAARTKMGAAVNHTTAHRGATAAEKKAAKQLEAGMREVQKAAKQKYARTNRIALADYFIGKKLNGSRSNLAQTSQTILGKVASDELPGITTAKVKALGAQRKSWLDASEAQVTAETAALDSRAELKTMIQSIKDRKLAIQLAADAEYPHTDEANAATRKEFALQPDRPLVIL